MKAGERDDVDRVLRGVGTITQNLARLEPMTRDAIAGYTEGKILEISEFIANLTSPAPQCVMSSVEQVDISKHLVRSAAKEIIFYEPSLVLNSQEQWSGSYRELLDVVEGRPQKIRRVAFLEGTAHEKGADVEDQKSAFSKAGFEVVLLDTERYRDLMMQHQDIAQTRMEAYDGEVILRVEPRSTYADNEEVKIALRPTSLDLGARTFLEKLRQRIPPKPSVESNSNEEKKDPESQ